MQFNYFKKKNEKSRNSIIFSCPSSILIIQVQKSALGPRAKFRKPNYKKTDGRNILASKLNVESVPTRLMKQLRFAVSKYNYCRVIEKSNSI